MDSLEGLSDDCLDAEQIRSLGCPISGRARAVLLAGENDERMSFLGVPEGSVTDVQHFSSGNVSGLRTDLGCQLVDDSGVGEGSAGHDFVVSSAGSVSVEVSLLDVSSQEVASSWGVLGDGARR